MLKIKNYIFALFLLGSILLFGQEFPDYQERMFLTLSDSLRSPNIMSQATEGSIDAEEYLIGAGDKLFISISGMQELNYTLSVNHEGVVFIPKVGVVDLRDLNLKQARKKIEEKILNYFKNVEVNVLLVELRKIKVSLIGDVGKPGVFIFPANARLMDLIINSAGLNPTANFREILIKSKNEENLYFDLLPFLRFGDRKNNPLLHEGDIVVVNKIDETVFIAGEVSYPGTYEFKEGETIEELIHLAGGLLNKARRDSIEVIRFVDDGFSQQSKFYSFDEIREGKIPLSKYDNILIRKIPRIFENRFVVISGMIKYPGYYKIKKDSTTLLDIIKEAGGLREEASLDEASLTRSSETEVTEDPEFERLKLIPVADMTEDEYDYLKAKSRQRAGRVVVDFFRLLKFNDQSENLILKKEDIINFPEVKNYITMLGQVVNPGHIIFEEKLSVEDYIQLAGGFGWRALEGDVRVIKAKTGEWIEADDVDKLEPGDTIWIPEDPPGPKFWDVFTTALSVVGQLAAVVAATVAVIIATK
ncbi:MAG: hypothetical protein AUK34_13790 [Ignavibacteria bacterium CG2_30_36_16]|nr:hypothetical protein [Ignavibacteria bacterium]OIP55228.1 MAG: hypothetical protein AUK34_13790 [Ignavibacteria bacterium CG2_30_36_16]